MDAGAQGAVAAALLLGASFGAEFDILAYLISRNFDARRFGQLFGTATGCVSLAGGTGPFVAALLYDRYGDYRWALATVACLALASAILVAGAASRRDVRADPGP